MHRRRLLHWVSQTTHPQLGWRNYPPVEKLRHSTRQRRMGLQRNCSHATWQRYTIEPKEWSRWHATTTRPFCFSNNIYYSPHYRRIVSKQGRARNRRNPGVIFTHTIVFFFWPLAHAPLTLLKYPARQAVHEKAPAQSRLFCVVRNRLHLLWTKNLQFQMKLLGNMRAFD